MTVLVENSKNDNAYAESWSVESLSGGVDGGLAVE